MKNLTGPVKIILLPVMLLVILHTTLHPIPTADLWWILAMGRYIITTGAVPSVNCFSFTAPDFPVVDHEWLFEVGLYQLYSVGGMVLLYLFKSAIIIAAYLLLYLTGKKRGVPGEFCAIAVITCVLLAKGNLYFDIRAYLVTYFFIALTLFILERERTAPGTPLLYILPAVCWVWANCHGGFILFFVFIFLHGISRGLENFIHKESAPPGKWRFALPLLLVLLVSLALSLVNPYTTQLLIYPFKFLKPSIFRSHLVEWVKPELGGTDLPFLIFFGGLVICALVWIKKLRIFDLLCLAVFGYLALTTVRHITIFCIVCVPVAARLYQVIYEEVAKTPIFNKFCTAAKKLPHMVKQGAGISVVLLLVVLAYNRFSTVDLENLNMEKSLFPRYAPEFIRKNKLPAPLYNPYEWGGYLLWKLYPDYQVFIDGRALHAYPESVYKESLMVMFGRDSWEDILNHYGINLVLCNKFFKQKRGKNWLGYVIDKSDGWKLIYEDRAEMIYIRQGSENSSFITRAEKGELMIPESPFTLRKKALKSLEQKKPEAAEKFLEEALQKDPTYSELYVDLGFVYYTQGKPEAARKVLLAGIKKDPTLYLAHDLLGVIYERQGNFKKARQEYKKALKIYPEFTRSKDALQRLQNIKE